MQERAYVACSRKSIDAVIIIASVFSFPLAKSPGNLVCNRMCDKYHNILIRISMFKLFIMQLEIIMFSNVEIIGPLLRLTTSLVLGFLYKVLSLFIACLFFVYKKSIEFCKLIMRLTTSQNF